MSDDDVTDGWTTIPLRITREQVADAILCFGLDPNHTHGLTIEPGRVSVELAVPGMAGTGTLTFGIDS